MASVSVGGLAELRNTLMNLGGEIASKNGGPVRSALAKGARNVRDLAKSLAPTGAGEKYGNSDYQPGRLARAIVAKRDREPGSFGLTESYVVRVKRGKDRADTRGAYYWGFVEFGTVKQNKQPFLRPAFEQSKTNFAENFTTDLRKAIASAVKRFAKNV